MGNTKIDGKELGNVGFKYLGVPYSQMDCQAFVEKCLSDCGCKKDLPGSNAWYREVYKHGWVGTPEECVKNYGEVPAGAFLFILLHDGKEPDKYKKDGLGNASHIGLCTGSEGEGAIHSSASRGCVAESKFKQKTIPNVGWNMVGLWDTQVDYWGLYPTPTPEPTPDPPEPDPPTPQPETAIVGNVPADKRQDVNMRKYPNTNASLVERVPVGETVEVLEYGVDWCKVKWHGYVGYMMTQYLIFAEPEPGEYYSVTIYDLSYREAEALKAMYPNSEINREGGQG